jgi:cholesterol transport system auxiliary component
MTMFKTACAALNSPAGRAGCRSVRAACGWLLVAAVLGGCALPDKPKRAALYDFGPGELSVETAGPQRVALAPLVIADITTAGGLLENQAVLYRLGYTDAQQLRPYSQARWTMPPAQLLRQRLRDRLGQHRVVLNARDGVVLNRSQHTSLPLLRLELEEFSQLFSAPEVSAGLIRLQATLLDITPGGERLVAQRVVVVQRPASSADAPGGVRALTAVADAAIDELEQWLRQMPAR